MQLTRVGHNTMAEGATLPASRTTASLAPVKPQGRVVQG
jgi:hypothetical protein